jgi:low temperature requirement protein LtrA
MVSQLIAPPRLRLSGRESTRQATWLELFYDLVFAVAVSVIGTSLFGQPTVLGLLQAIALFVPIWWAWVGHTIYNTRFDTDDLLHRLITFGIMLAAAGMAITVPYAFKGGAGPFAATYVAARLCLFIMYGRAYHYVPEARPIIRLYLGGFGLGDSLWLLSIFTPAPWCYLLWLIGTLISFATPWLGITMLQKSPVDTSHVPVRFASFTIIMLGQIIAVTVGQVIGQALQSSSTLAVFLSFGITACVWWIYFTFLDVAPVGESLSSGQPFIYVHLPLVCGLLLLSIGLEKATVEARHALLTVDTRWLLILGMTLWSLSGLSLKMVIVRCWPNRRIFIRLGFLAAMILLFGFGGAVFSPLLVLALFLCIMLVYSSNEGFLLMREAQQEKRAGSLP